MDGEGCVEQKDGGWGRERAVVGGAWAHVSEMGWGLGSEVLQKDRVELSALPLRAEGQILRNLSVKPAFLISSRNYRFSPFPSHFCCLCASWNNGAPG